jgi:hypothetical protein
MRDPLALHGHLQRFMRFYEVERPEGIVYIAARLASQGNYRRAAAILNELLPVHPRFGHVCVRAATLDADSRLDRDQIHEPISGWRRIRSEARSVTLAYDGGCVRRTGLEVNNRRPLPLENAVRTCSHRASRRSVIQ